MPHCGHGHKAGTTQSLCECITRKGCRDVCSAQWPVNTYATHVYLHKCRVTGLLQRGKGESAETWWHSKNFLRDAVCQSVCAGGLEITCGFQMWKRTSICILKWEGVFVFFDMMLNMSHLSDHMILWYFGAYLWTQASGGASEDHRLGFPLLLWPSVTNGVCSSWASPSTLYCRESIRVCSVFSFYWMPNLPSKKRNGKLNSDKIHFINKKLWGCFFFLIGDGGIC